LGRRDWRKRSGSRDCNPYLCNVLEHFSSVPPPDSVRNERCRSSSWNSCMAWPWSGLVAVSPSKRRKCSAVTWLCDDVTVLGVW